MRTVESYKIPVNDQVYTYVAREEREDFDQEGAHNVKYYHEVYDESGKSHPMDWTSYSIPSKQNVALWISLGMPTRRDLKVNGPLNSELLQKLHASRNKKGNLGESEVSWLKKWAGISG